MSGMSVSLDRGGIVASSLCALHCGVCALLPGLLGTLGLSEVLGHEAEGIFVLVALGFALFSLVVGIRRHGDWVVGGVLMLGMAGLIAARVTESLDIHGLELVLGVGAAFFLVGGHVMNIRASRCCDTGCLKEQGA